MAQNLNGFSCIGGPKIGERPYQHQLFIFYWSPFLTEIWAHKQ